MRYLYVQDLGALFISSKSIGFSVARKMREARSIDSPECPFNLQISNLYHDSRQRFFGLDGLDHIHSTIKFIKTCGGNTIYTVDLTSLYTPDSIPQFSLISEFKGMPLTSLKIDFGKHFDESSYLRHFPLLKKLDLTYTNKEENSAWFQNLIRHVPNLTSLTLSPDKDKDCSILDELESMQYLLELTLVGNWDILDIQAMEFQKLDKLTIQYAENSTRTNGEELDECFNRMWFDTPTLMYLAVTDDINYNFFRQVETREENPSSES